MPRTPRCVPLRVAPYRPSRSVCTAKLCKHEEAEERKAAKAGVRCGSRAVCATECPISQPHLPTERKA